MEKVLAAVLTVVLVLLSSLAFSQEKTVDEILAIVDGNLTKVTDTTYEGMVEVIQNKKVIKTLYFGVKLKGLQK